MLNFYGSFFTLITNNFKVISNLILNLKVELELELAVLSV